MRARMDAGAFLADGALFVALVGGIYVGARLALAEAARFVEEALREVRVTSLELLANPTTQALVRAASAFAPKKGGSVLGQIAGALLGQLGQRPPPPGGAP